MGKADDAVAWGTWPAAGAARRWVPVLQAGALIAAGGYLFAPLAAKLRQLWWASDTHSYAALIPLACAYFAWDKRAQLRALASSPSAWAIPAAALAVAALGLGSLGNILGLQTLGLVIYASAVVLTVWGTAVWRVLIFPLGFLVFLVPVPAVLLDRIAYPLQLFAANFAGLILEAVGIPVMIDGILIHLPNTVLQVAVACAGLRFLVTTATVGVVVAYWGQRTLVRGALVAALAIPIAILANASRVAITGVLAYVVGAEAAEGFFHSFSGSIVFWLGIAVLLGTSAAVRRIGR